MVKLDYVYELANPKYSGRGSLTFLGQVSFLFYAKMIPGLF